MNRVERMFAEHCAVGVDFENLGNLVQIKNGSDYKHLGTGSVPVYGSGGIMTTVDQSVYSGPSVLIPRKGSLDKLYFVDGPFWTVDTIFYTIVGERIDPKFLFHYLANAHLENLNQAGGVPSLTQTVLRNLIIPVPPLEVQREIVTVLDTFTRLEAELEAELQSELAARRAQYAFYRDQLLNFEAARKGGRTSLLGLPPFEVEWIPLGEFAALKRGHGMPKSVFLSEGIPAIHYGHIYTAYGVSTVEAKVYVSSENARGLEEVLPGDIVMATTSENIEDIGKSTAWLGERGAVAGGHATIVRSTNDSRYLSHYFRTEHFFRDKKRCAVGTKVVELSLPNLSRIRVPIPPINVQRCIADVLDSFDALVNDLSSGLPAEIAARRQQYEYYRDKLLTFPEKK